MASPPCTTPYLTAAVSTGERKRTKPDQLQMSMDGNLINQLLSIVVVYRCVHESTCCLTHLHCKMQSAVLCPIHKSASGQMESTLVKTLDKLQSGYSIIRLIVWRTIYHLQGLQNSSQKAIVFTISLQTVCTSQICCNLMINTVRTLHTKEKTTCTHNR